MRPVSLIPHGKRSCRCSLSSSSKKKKRRRKGCQCVEMSCVQPLSKGVTVVQVVKSAAGRASPRFSNCSHVTSCVPTGRVSVGYVPKLRLQIAVSGLKTVCFGVLPVRTPLYSQDHSSVMLFYCHLCLLQYQVFSIKACQ